MLPYTQSCCSPAGCMLHAHTCSSHACGGPGKAARQLLLSVVAQAVQCINLCAHVYLLTVASPVCSQVAQLAGYVAQHSAYHHGEASLAATIVGLAQNFVGSNNINLLHPAGQFGSRLQVGSSQQADALLAQCPRHVHSAACVWMHACMMVRCRCWCSNSPFHGCCTAGRQGRCEPQVRLHSPGRADPPPVQRGGRPAAGLPERGGPEDRARVVRSTMALALATGQLT